MSGLKLIQFRCQIGGELFYFQGYKEFMFWWPLWPRCPFCRSKRVVATGREYPPLNERDPEKFTKE